MNPNNHDISLRKIRKVNAGIFADTDDTLSVEEPLEISLAYNNNGINEQKVISVTMRTPGNDEELAAGFLFTEGIIKSKEQISSAAAIPSAENKILVTLGAGAMPVLQKTERNFYTTSSCGVCGKTSIDAIKTVSVFNNIKDGSRIDTGTIYSLPGKLREKQVSFNNTGGIHAAALFDLPGNMMMMREDVGRHNALDKIIGTALFENKLPLTETVLLLSGRASFELVQKAMMAGIKLIAAVGAPSSLAAETAQEAGITLIGFLRGNSFNIYTHSQRIKTSA